jgi:excinuclease ABC subunit A
MTAKPGVLRDELPRLRQRGFQRVRLDGEIRSPRRTEAGALGRGGDHGGAGRRPVVITADQRSRLADSLELAFREGQNRALVLVQPRPRRRGARSRSARA